MRIDVLTLFPKMFAGPFDESIIKRGRDKGLVEIKIHNLRNWGVGRHQTLDDRPYGGGVGMVMMVEPLTRAIEELKTGSFSVKPHVIFLTPSGRRFDQRVAERLSKHEHLILLAGHYETVDQRVIDTLVDEELSIGDYVLTGGELPAMVLTDTVARLIPGVLEKKDATANESFEEVRVDGRVVALLEYPQYTRPEEFRGMKVPEVLLSGDPKKIDKWKTEKALEKTKKNRPDLLSE